MTATVVLVENNTIDVQAACDANFSVGMRLSIIPVAHSSSIMVFIPTS